MTETATEETPQGLVNEEVLVFPAYLLDDYLSAFKLTQGVITGESVQKLFREILESGDLFYLERDQAEETPEWKQLIPYTILRRGREVFRYQRTSKGGENRLHGKWSIGVGGHINPCDGVEPEDAFVNGFLRELKEEVGLGECASSLTAMLYDDSDAVGQVHFGVVHQVQIGFNQPLKLTDPAMQGGYWQHPTELRDVESFENWSRLVIPLL